MCSSDERLFCSDDWDCLSTGLKGPIGMKFKKFWCKCLKYGNQKFWVDILIFFLKRSFRNFALKMCSDKCFIKHALTYSAITFIIAALAAYFLFYNVSCRPIDKKPIYKQAMQNFKSFWGEGALQINLYRS